MFMKKPGRDKGIVYLVGAGPGDVGLFTVKGLKCLREADVVVYDFHLNAQILNYINHDAEFIYAGKRGGHHTMSQDEINDVIAGKAEEGKVVTRLKGGDPFVFGRGGEEAQRLHREGIPFEVVPAVSSSIAAPAYAGIPLTHRNYASTFAVIPGYEDVTKESSSIDWSKLATGVDTLVFLMAIKNIKELTEKLIANGRHAETPVAVIRWGTRADQETLVTTLDSVAAEVKERDIRPPAVMVVGDVVKLREELNWYELKPLFGLRIMITREDASPYGKLEDLGAEVVSFPTIKVIPPESWDELDAAINNIGEAEHVPHWLIFTSANGVKYFFQRMTELERDVRDLKGIKICAVGTKTAARVEEKGFRVDMVPGKFNAEGLIESFLEFHDGSLNGIRFLMPRAEVAREVLPDKIREMGGHIVVPATYRAVVPSRRPKRLEQFMREGRISVATFTSGATFDNFLTLATHARELLKGVAIAAIGPVTRKAIEKAGLKVDIEPEEATNEALVEAIIEWVESFKT
jgi:uroporphyrinogen III methyltransferase/synthase